MKLYKSYPHYFQTQQGFSLYFKTNFPLSEFSKDKKLFVFNYGLVCSESHFKFQLEYLDRKKEQTLVHDYRGHYNSFPQCPPKDITFSNISNDISEILNYLGADKHNNNIFIAHSMGVNITLELALKKPDLVQKMILLSGTVLPPSQVMFNSNIMTYISPLQKKILSSFPNLYQSLWKNAFLNPLVRKLVYFGGFNTETVDEVFVQTYMKKIGELRPEVFIQLFDEMKNHHIINELPNIMSSALIIAGEKDRVIPIDAQSILAQKLPKSVYKTISEGSHVPQMDFPDLVSQWILDFSRDELL